MQQKKKTKAGTKARQREDKIDRAAIWRDKRRQFKVDGVYNHDIDFLEFGFVRGEGASVLVPLLSLELTKCDNESLPGDNYLNQIIWRYFERDKQGVVATEIADILGIPSLLVVFNNNADRMHVYDLKKREGWIKNVSWDRYLQYLNKLKRQL